MLLTIEKLIYGGEGLAHLPHDDHGPGKAAFVPFVLEGERVEAETTEQKRGFARLRVRELIEAAAARVAPACPYFGDCGGCHYQHASYGHQLEIKQRILRETFLRIAKISLPEEIVLHPSPPWKYRNRTRMRVRANPFSLGYNRFRAHQLLPVRTCPISSELINQAIAELWRLGSEGRVPAKIREVEFFTSAEDDRLLLEITPADATVCVEELRALAKFAAAFRSSFPQLAGVALVRRGEGGEVLRSEFPNSIREEFGASALAYSCAGTAYKVSAGSFFQTNRFLAPDLVEVATRGLRGKHALDLYAGVGLFSVPLSKSFQAVDAVEASPLACEDLRCNAAGVRAHCAAVEDFLRRLPANRRFDLIVVDPPRSGLGERAARALARLGPPLVVYVSCDPSTLARDVQILANAGYGIEAAHLLDLFPQTFHIESVFRLRKF